MRACPTVEHESYTQLIGLNLLLGRVATIEAGLSILWQLQESLDYLKLQFITADA